MASPFSKDTSDFFARLVNSQKIFLAILLIVIAVNSFNFFETLNRAQQKRKIIPFVFYGIIFSGLENVFQDVKYVGYFTDRDQANDESAAEFAQVQYAIAPAILDLNYQKHQFILFDCTDEAIAMAKIKEMGAIPLKRNKFGIILARQPVWKSD